MTEQLKNILIGLFVAVAITIGISLALFLDPSVGDGKKKLQVRFINISGIAIGTRVTYGGKVVGEVSSIKEVPDARELAVDDSGKVYLYQLTLKIDSSVKVYTTDEIAMRTTGLMGERTIAILPRLSPKGTEPIPITNQILYANSIDPMEHTINQIGKVATRVQVAVDHFDQWFVANEAQISSAIHSFDKTFSEAGNILASVEQEQIVPAVKRSVDLVNLNLDSIYHTLEDDQLLKQITNLVAAMNQTMASINTDGTESLRHINKITADIANGTGTLGKLITSEDFYLRVSSVMGKVETLMTDINHYGILFQYDKSWQRQRTKRITQMKALDTPSDFRNYFEGEVGSIQASLGRLTELLDRAQDTPERQKIVQSEAFKRDFASLLRQVQGLTDAIKLYNEELVAPADNPDQAALETFPSCNLAR